MQMQGGDHESAGYSLNKALLNSPGYVPALNLRIQLDLQKGDVASAENRVNELLAKSGDNAEAQLLMGDLRMSQKRYTDAIIAYQHTPE